jgi:hypothetical protein
VAASVPPFCSLLFEEWARRTGRLDRPTGDRPVTDR